MKFATILIVYLALVLLLGLTIGLAYLPTGAMGETWKPIIGLLIAAMKAGLVVAFFMHLKYQSGLVRLFAVAGLFWLLILFILTLADYLTRQWM